MHVVTLTTDFGKKDYYAATLKGAILKNSKDVQLIDISHQISPYDIVEGAFFISNAYRHFPAGSIHVAVVNDYSLKDHTYIVFEKEEHIFIGPDNGLFSLIFNGETFPVYQIEVENIHNADIQSLIGHAVAYLTHKLPLEEIGTRKESLHQKIGLRAVTTSNQIRATITHVDQFGNVIVNLKKEHFDKVRNNRSFEIYYKSRDPIGTISSNYNDVSVGDVLCMFNSAEYLEIAINMGNANELLNLNKNETIQIDFL